MKNHWLMSMSDRSKLIMFAALSMIGMGVGSTLMFVVAGLMLPEGMGMEQLFNQPTAELQDALKWGNTSMLIGFYLFPVIMYRLLFGRSKALSFGFFKQSHWWFVAPFILIFLSGMADILGAFNVWLMDQLQLQTLDEMQNNADQLQRIMLSPSNGLQWFSTIVALIIAPAILEELFFRGALQNLLQRLGGGHHAAIWATAAAFSAMHLQFEGFLPRMFLGLLMGYLYYWSGSLTTSIIAHAVNNALALVLFSIFQSFEWSFSEQRWVELFISFGTGFIGIAITQWAYRRNKPSSELQQE